MTTATPLARYGAIEGALASGFATALLHHWWGRDLRRFVRPGVGGNCDITPGMWARCRKTASHLDHRTPPCFRDSTRQC
ncbi:hypothetical protein EPK84_11000 (plasmid) [Sinorhizobium fredii]|nr:hypothetical protein EPK84_11000 [Sinorhizobium fredii]